MIWYQIKITQFPSSDIENGLGREISKKEALEVLVKAEEDGLVHHSSNTKDNKIFICNCCSCCCKALSHVIKYDNPTAIAPSNYIALVDTEMCTGCETCIERCQVGAIQMGDDLSVIDRQRCIGCGLCVSTCPEEAISMAQRKPEEMSVVFENQDEVLQSIAKEKNKVYPFE